MPKKTINVGDRVVIKNRGGGWDGITGVVESIGSSDNRAPYHIRYDHPASTPLGPPWAGGDWSRQYLKSVSRKVEQLELANERITALIREKTEAEVAVEDLRAEVDRARRSERIEIDKVADLRATLHEAQEQIDRAGRRIDQLKESANEAIDDLQAKRAHDFETLQHLYLEVNEAHAALDYSYANLLNQRQRNRLAGFRDGYAQRVIDVPGN